MFTRRRHTAIGHCVILGTPSIQFVQFWRIPCQWIPVPLFVMLLVTWMTVEQGSVKIPGKYTASGISAAIAPAEAPPDRTSLTDGISPVCLDGRAGDGSVHSQTYPFNAIWRDGRIGDIEPVLQFCQHLSTVCFRENVFREDSECSSLKDCLTSTVSPVSGTSVYQSVWTE